MQTEELNTRTGIGQIACQHMTVVNVAKAASREAAFFDKVQSTTHAHNDTKSRVRRRGPACDTLDETRACEAPY